MAHHAHSSTKLIVTIAADGARLSTLLDNNLPPLHTLDTLERDGSLTEDGSFLLIAVAPNRADETARWIKRRFQRAMVVHLGETMAATSPEPGENWIVPSRVLAKSGQPLPLDTRIPFPWPASVPLQISKEPLTDRTILSQAQVYKDTDISFHVRMRLKGDPGEPTGFAASRTLPRVLEFLTGPGEPDISAIVPVHNRADRIVPCVESILSQSLPAKEVIVVDDGSTDGTREALASLRSEITVLSLPHNRGVSVARNTGVASASGTWISFLDSDDLWTKDKLRHQWRFLRQHPFYEIVQSEEIWIRNGIRVNPRNHHKKPEGWIWLPSLSLCLVSPSSVLMKKELLQTYGGFDPSLPACEDYDLWLRLSRNHPVGLDPSPSVIKHGGHPDQLSRRYPAMDRFRVTALLKALDNETDVAYATAVRNILKKKLTILINGCKKRQKLDDVRRFESLIRNVDSPGGRWERPNR